MFPHFLMEKSEFRWHIHAVDSIFLTNISPFIKFFPCLLFTISTSSSFDPPTIFTLPTGPGSFSSKTRLFGAVT